MVTLAIRIFRWADAPLEYRVTAERQWVAFVPAGQTFDAATGALWENVVSDDVEGGEVQAGDEPWLT